MSIIPFSKDYSSLFLQQFLQLDILSQMTITKAKPFTKEEILQLHEQFEIYIKAIIQTQTQTCSAGGDLHHYE